MKKMIVLTVLAVLIVTPATMADIYWDDGLSHTIDDPTYQTYIALDYNIANDPGTHADLVDGGIGSNIELFNKSTLTISGGMTSIVLARGNSEVTMLSGSAMFLLAFESSTITMSGGSGGLMYRAEDDGIIYLDGTGFEVDVYGAITSLSIGDKLSNFGEDGVITGTLADGSYLDVPFEIPRFSDDDTADIIIIPEPCSLILLSLGGLILRRLKA